MTVVLVSCREMPKPDLDAPALAEALAARGIDAVTAAWDEPRDWAAAELVVLRTPWDYVERLDEFLPWVASTGAVAHLANPAEVVAWNHHKRYLFDLEAAGVPIVPTRMVAQHAPFPFQRAVVRRFEGEVVIKPAVGIGAFGAARLEAGSEESFAQVEALCLLGDVLVQPMVPSVATEGEVSMIYLGGEFSHAVRKRPAPGDYRVQDHHGGTVVEHVPTAAERAVAEEALAAASLQAASLQGASLQGDGAPLLYARVDLVDFAGPVVMELELIEPELFLRRDPASAARLADAVATRLAAQRLR
ncbi:MAG: hypothetical protein U0Q22_07725 [Acidimicrobiales bacterium]